MNAMPRERGFEIVREDKRMGNGIAYAPLRGSKASAGYDFFLPHDVVIPPKSMQIVWTNVKAYMLYDEVLEVYVRSSVGVKHGVVLANGTGIIDSDYYNNPDNDGNIGIPLYNTNDHSVSFKGGTHVAQGIFKKFLTVDLEDTSSLKERIGGVGSTTNANG